MKNTDNFPVFIVGSSRSGTTLLYSILISSGAFASYQAETHLLDICQPKYGNIRRNRNYKKFIRDWTNSKQFFRSGLDLAEFEKNAIKHRESYADFLRFFMESVCKKQGKTRWAEQTPGHIFHMDILYRAFQNARFIHIIRDGRDVALSRRKLRWTGTKSDDSLKQLLSAGKCWEIAINKGRALAKKFGDAYIEIRYEDIINDLEEILIKIGDFVCIDLSKKKIRDSSIGSLGKANSAFVDDMKGISNKAMKRWEKELNNDEIIALDLTIGKTLRKLGYNAPHYQNINSSKVPLKIRSYLFIKPFYHNFTYFLKQKTFFGRYISDQLEIGLK